MWFYSVFSSTFIEPKAGCKLGRSASTSGVPSPVGTPQRHASDASAPLCGTPFQVEPPYSSEWCEMACVWSCGLLSPCLWPLTPTAVCKLSPVCRFCCCALLSAFIICPRRCICVCLCLVQIRAVFPSCSEEALTFNTPSVSLCQEIHNQGFIYLAV